MLSSATFITLPRAEPLTCQQDVEMQLADQKPQWSAAANTLDSKSMDMQQSLTLMQQQIQDEEARLQQLTESISSFRQKAILVNNPAEAASSQARYDV